MRVTHAIVRPPGANFAAGLTTAGLGAPNLAAALAQHEAYVAALAQAGVEVTRLPPDDNFPDSTFVEDPAIVTARGAIRTRPGAPSRRGEVAAVRAALERFFPELAEIAPPGTLDGGDVCAADGRFLIGLSARTNADGARQLAAWLARQGWAAELIDLRGRPALLHLKSGLAHVGGRTLVVVEALADEPALCDYEKILVPAGEEYAANCLRVNDALFVARGFPELESRLRALNIPLVPLDVSEFRKMDGGLSCLSLRW
jgi:dimethylargininase